MTTGSTGSTGAMGSARSAGPVGAPESMGGAGVTEAAGAGRLGRARVWGAALAVCALALTGCSAQAVAGGGSTADTGTGTGTGGTGTDADAKPGGTAGVPLAKPEPKPLKSLEGARVNIADRQTVGVGMPISVTFRRPVPTSERADAERQLRVTISNGTTGSWSWIKDRNLLDGQRVDFRPRAYWKPGTEVTVRAGADLTRRFTIGRSLVATVDVRSHTMKVEKDGSTRRIPVTAGAPGMDTWNGTMVVSDKQRRVFMDSRTVGYGDTYADYYDYAVHLTTSGTYLHQNPKANTYAGRQNVTHGCIGLATDGTASRFYGEVIPGDVVKVTGSKDTVAEGNGYGDWNLSWDQWQTGSAL